MNHTMLTPGRHDVTIHGARLAYHVHGEGPTIVAWPGGPGFSHAYLRTPRLEARHRVVYVDPIGCGDSAELADPSQYSLARDVADLEELRAHLDLPRITILGHSAGGFVAQKYAIDHPERVERLVLLDTSPTNGAEFEASLKAELGARADRPWFPAAAAALQAAFTRLLADEEAAALMPVIAPLYSYDGDAAVTQKLIETGHLRLARLQRATKTSFDFRPALAGLSVPALVVVGARDFICAPVLARMLHEALAGSRFVLLERSGHMAHLEQPEELVAAIEAFVRAAP